MLLVSAHSRVFRHSARVLTVLRERHIIRGAKAERVESLARLKSRDAHGPVRGAGGVHKQTRHKPRGNSANVPRNKRHNYSRIALALRKRMNSNMSCWFTHLAKHPPHFVRHALHRHGAWLRLLRLTRPTPGSVKAAAIDVRVL